jgi:2-oxoglutarate dehydrogenase E1 component
MILQVIGVLYKQRDLTKKFKTGVPKKDIKRLSNIITTLPESLQLHGRVKKIMDSRQAMAAGEVADGLGFCRNNGICDAYRSGL